MMGCMEALELIVDEGRPANAGRFFQLGADLLALLDELTDVPVAWHVDELRTGSAVARVAPPDQAADNGRWLRRAALSLRSVSQGERLPEDWSPDAAKAAHRFVEDGQPVDQDEDWVPPRLVLVEDEKRSVSVDLTGDLGERLGALQPFERTMPGAVRGTLVGLNVSRGNRASLRLPGRRIVRVGFDSSLRGDLKEALYQQVEIAGVVRQDGDGRVFHVRAESLTPLAAPEARWVDLVGMAPGFTGDLSTEEWLEASRGDA